MTTAPRSSSSSTGSLRRSTTTGGRPAGWTSCRTSTALFRRSTCPVTVQRHPAERPRRIRRGGRGGVQFLAVAGATDAVGFSAGADLLLHMAISHPGHFERIALLGLGDNVFATRDASTLALALESDDEPEDVQARVFYRLAVSSGNDRRALAAFIRRQRPAIAEDDLSTVTCPVLVVLGDRDMTTRRPGWFRAPLGVAGDPARGRPFRHSLGLRGH